MELEMSVEKILSLSKEFTYEAHNGLWRVIDFVIDSFWWIS